MPNIQSPDKNKTSNSYTLNLQTSSFIPSLASLTSLLETNTIVQKSLISKNTISLWLENANFSALYLQIKITANKTNFILDFNEGDFVLVHPKTSFSNFVNKLMSYSYKQAEWKIIKALINKIKNKIAI